MITFKKSRSLLPPQVGGVTFTPTNTYDIGVSATDSAPRTIYAGTSMVAPLFTSTTAFRSNNGTEALPSHSFTGGTSTGMLFDGAVLMFSLGGAGKAYFTGDFYNPRTTGVQGLGESTVRWLKLFTGTGGIDTTGDVVIAMGTGSGTAKAPGTANVNTTAVGNVGIGTDDLMTYSLPANSLSANGKGVRITVWGTAANNANAKTVTVAFGATTLVSTALTASQADVWWAEAIVIRTGAATQEAFAELTQGGTVTLSDVEQSNPAETLSGAVTIKCTGTATANDDIVQEGMVVEFYN